MMRWIWLVMLLVLSGCDSASQFLPKLLLPSRQPAAPIAPAQSATVAQMEEQVRQRINEIRQKEGLSPLRSNARLAQVARNYSRKMAERKFFSHTSPDGDSMVDRVHSAGIFYFMLGENLFTCTNVPQPVPASIKGWMNSPGHRENVLRSEYRETGIGVWRIGNTYYFTQLFMRSL